MMQYLCNKTAKSSSRLYTFSASLTKHVSMQHILHSINLEVMLRLNYCESVHQFQSIFTSTQFSRYTKVSVVHHANFNFLYLKAPVSQSIKYSNNVLMWHIQQQ